MENNMIVLETTNKKNKNFTDSFTIKLWLSSSLKVRKVQTRTIFEHDFKNKGALTILGWGSAKDDPKY